MKISIVVFISYLFFVTLGFCDDIELTWNAQENATGYKVYRSKKVVNENGCNVTRWAPAVKIGNKLAHKFYDVNYGTSFKIVAYRGEEGLVSWFVNSEIIWHEREKPHRNFVLKINVLDER